MGHRKVSAKIAWLAACYAALIGCGDSSAKQGVEARDAAMPDDAALPADADTPSEVGHSDRPQGPVDPNAIHEVDVCPQRPLPQDIAVDTSNGVYKCTKSSDCTAQPNGVCLGLHDGDGVIRYPRCQYEECTSDAQCRLDERCECGFAAVRRCVHVGCARDADCGSSERCLRLFTGCSYEPLGDYQCTTPDDQCVTHEDCVDAGLGSWCYGQDGRRTCRQHTCD